MNYCCRRHGTKCPYSSFNPRNLIPPCGLHKFTQPCSPQCPYCKLNHRLYCYYLEGYRHMLKNKDKQLCMMEYFVRQMNYLKNAIQHQLQQCEELQCFRQPECEIKYSRPKCYDYKNTCHEFKPQCYEFKPKYYGIECDTTPCFSDKSSSKASTYAELLDRINYITQKLSCLETKNCAARLPPRKCSVNCSTESDECYIPTAPPHCKKYRFVQCEPPPQCYMPPSCSKKKPSCCTSHCYTCPPKCYVSCESTCAQAPPKKKSSLVFEISYETREKKKRAQPQTQGQPKPQVYYAQPQAQAISSSSTPEPTSSTSYQKIERKLQRDI